MDEQKPCREKRLSSKVWLSSVRVYSQQENVNGRVFLHHTALGAAYDLD